MKSIRNLKFRTKIILSFIIILLINGALSGGLYYNYAFKDTLKNYYSSTEDIVSQMRFFLINETKSITQKVHATFNNPSFYAGLGEYLRHPESLKYPKLQGDAADIITELIQGDRYIHSVSIHTPYGTFENFTRILDREAKFEDSVMYQYFQENPSETIGWFSAMKSPVFKGNEVVIPVVYRFQIERKDVFVVVCMQQSEIRDYLERTYTSYEKIFLVDKNGNDLFNMGEEDREVLWHFSPEEVEGRNSICKEVKYQGKTYLATYATTPGNQWQICALKSADSLVGNLNDLRYFILGVIIGCAAAGAFVIIVIAHELTVPLARLAATMRQVTNENFDVRFDYPYRDEAGTLGSSFNYMINKINHLIRELNIKIEELKNEKEMVRKVQEQKRKAELKALQAQINPHFLYNTLNAITWQAADQNVPEISIMSSSLGKFFRISLSKGHQVITIREEIEHVASYLEIQKIRYKDRISYDVDIPDDMKELFIIKLVLQPLVENSIYHGIKEKNTKGTIRIKVERRFSGTQIPEVVIHIWDNGNGIEPKKLKVLNQNLTSGMVSHGDGYGIYNINERIRLFFGENYGLTLASSYLNWTEATVVIPVKTTGDE